MRKLLKRIQNEFGYGVNPKRWSNKMRKEYLTNYNEATWHTNKLNAKSREFMEEIRSGKYDIPRDKKCRKERKRKERI